MRLPIPPLDDAPDAPFPSPERALAEPDGLLAYGGDLSPMRLLNAYHHGIFPWYSQGQPILWWSPSRRAVFATDGVHLSSRLRRSMRKSGWMVRADTRFAEVITACAAAPRPGQSGTWITAEMIAAYVELHRLGHAHSIEVFDGTRLVGGLYGVAAGRMFCGESMFSVESGASSLALAALAKHLHGRGWPLVDAQVLNDHTHRLGAREWPRQCYLDALARLRTPTEPAGPWTAGFGNMSAAEACQAPA